jgi:hypothetical protein
MFLTELVLTVLMFLIELVLTVLVFPSELGVLLYWCVLAEMVLTVLLFLTPHLFTSCQHALQPPLVLRKDE